MAEILPEVDTSARIKVLGIGGGGGAAVERMLKSNLQGIDFAVINTDAQALLHSHATVKIHIGAEATRGLGAGADPEVGKRAAEESEKDLFEAVKGTDMVFITLGEGGGTGTGAAPLVAAAAREAGALVVGIVTKPFSFEGERRRRSAEAGIEALKQNVDTLITIPNDRLLQMIDRKTSLMDAFTIVDEVLQQGVQGISNLITIHGLINLDFADVKAIMSNAGSALMGIGRAKGDNRATDAARQAIDSPLLETSIDGARGVLFNITGGRNMSMHEIDEAAKVITDAVDPEANIIFGAVLDESLDDDILITVVATGFDGVARPVATRTAIQHQAVTHHTPTVQPQPEVVEEPVVAATVPEPESVVAEAEPEIVEPEPVIEPEPEPELIEPEPSYVNPVVLPGVRPSFINERPKGEDEPAQPPRRFAPIASIEPEDNDDEIPGVDEPIVTKPSFEEAPVETTISGPAVGDDDLDVPAFIRRKVD